MANKDLYEENKRLKAQIKRMEDAERNKIDAERAEFEALFKLAVTSLKDFLEGRARLHVKQREETDYVITFGY